MSYRINVGRATSGGVYGGIFGNPIRERVVTEQYRRYFRSQVCANPSFVEALRWLYQQLNKGAVLYCPGCGTDCPTCHARVIEVELKELCRLGLEKYREELC